MQKAERSCTVKGHSHFVECKTISSPATVYSLRIRSGKGERDDGQFSESKVVQIKAQVVLLIVQLKGNTVYTKNVRLNLEGFWVQAY